MSFSSSTEKQKIIISKESKKLTNLNLNIVLPNQKPIPQTNTLKKLFRIKIPKLSHNYTMVAPPPTNVEQGPRRRGRPPRKVHRATRSSYINASENDEVSSKHKTSQLNGKNSTMSPDNEENSVLASEDKGNQSDTVESETNGISSDSRSTRLKKRSRNDSQADETASVDAGEEAEFKAVNSDEDEFYIDPEGETKINHDGVLLGDRTYAVHTFTIPSRHPTRLYVWGSTLAKCLGATDSHKIISPYPQLKRIYPNSAPELKDLAATPGYGIKYNLLTARSAFLVFGSKILRNGRVGVDDYYRYEIHKPRRIKPANFKPTARTEAANLAKSKGAFLTPLGMSSRPPLKYKSISDPEYLYLLARETNNFNSDLSRTRVDKPVFYEPHTNMYQVPQSTQISNFRVSMVNFSPVPFSSIPNVMEKHQVKSSLQVQSHQDYSICDVDEQTLNLLPSDIIQEIDQLKKQRDAQITKPTANLYPIALAEGQPQSHPSLYPVRFNQDHATPFLSSLDAINRPNGLPPVDNGAPSILPNISKPPLLAPNSFPTRTPMKNIVNLSRPMSETGRYISPRDLSTKKRCGVISLKTQAPCKNFISSNGKYCDNHFKYFSKHGKGDMDIRRNSPTSTSVASFANDNTPTVDSDNEDASGDSEEYDHCEDCKELLAPDEMLEHAGSVDDIVPNTDTIQCHSCKNQYHSWCVRIFSSQLRENVRKYDWECSECKKCSVCKSSEDDAELIFCDLCDRAFHTYCHNPKVPEIPEGSWICHSCS